MTQMITVRVTRREAVADGVLALTLCAADGTPLPPWEPGAHVDVRLPGDLIRQYSLCGDPEDLTGYRVGVLREVVSRGGSWWIHDELRVGDELAISLPRNNFQLTDAAGYVFIAGGIGITPILALVREADQRGKPWRLLYGGRSRGSMAFREELQALDAGRGFVVEHPQDEAGLLPLRPWLSEPRGDTLVYCCGPAPLLDAVEFETLLWPRKALRVERFTAVPLAPPARTEAFDVVLARTGRTVTVPPERSVLDALADLGIGMLSSCREGVCGTCVTRFLDGIPDHRDSILTAQARENGDRMYLCVSRSCTDRLVLDL